MGSGGTEERMKFIYCDETNMEARSGDFLIYGGLTIDHNEYQGLTEEIWGIRDRYKIDRSMKIKFNPGPKHLEHQDFISFKTELIRAAQRFNCKFLVYHVLHDLAKDADLGRRNGINEICLNFSYLLKKYDTSGMVLLDRFNDAGNKIEGHLSEKFSLGLIGLPYSKDYLLNRIVGYHYSSTGQSHMPSLIDVILGSYRFALNCHTRGQSGKLASAKAILESLEPLFEKDSSNMFIPRISVSFSPLEVRVPNFKDKYLDAISFLRENGLNITQQYA